MTNNNVETRNHMSPPLRFPEFESEWEEKKLGEITKIERGRFSPRPRNNPIYYGGNIPFVQTSDVVNSNGIINKHSQTLNKKGIEVSKLFFKGDLLITIAANIGYAGVLQYDMACPDSLIGLKCNDNIRNIFLNYLLKIEQPKMDYLAVAVAQKNINIEFLRPYKFIIPKSLLEQTKIATFLTAVDQRISLLQKKKAQLEQYKKGVMQKIFSQEIRFKDENGKDFPDWEEERLGDVFSHIGGTSLEKYSSYKGDYNFISIGNYSKTGKYIDNGQRVLLNDKTKQKLLDKNNLVMVLNDKTKTGDIIGATILIDRNDAYIYNQRSERLICNENVTPLYAWFFLNSRLVRNKIFSIAQGGTQIYVNFPVVKELLFDFPYKTEQQKIANFLSSIDKSIEKVSNQIDGSVAFKQSLLQKMFV